MGLAEALKPHLALEPQILALVAEVQGWYANGNHVVSWQRLIRILEQVLGAELGR